MNPPPPPPRDKEIPGQVQHLEKSLTLSSVIASAGSQSLLAGSPGEIKPRSGWTLGLCPSAEGSGPGRSSAGWGGVSESRKKELGVAGAGQWCPLVPTLSEVCVAQCQLKHPASWSGLTLSTEGTVPFLSVCLGSGTQHFSQLGRPGPGSPHIRWLLQQGLGLPASWETGSETWKAARVPSSQGRCGQRILSDPKKGAAGLERRGCQGPPGPPQALVKEAGVAGQGRNLGWEEGCRLRGNHKAGEGL